MDFNNLIDQVDIIDICRDLNLRNSNYLLRKYWIIREILINFKEFVLYNLLFLIIR